MDNAGGLMEMICFAVLREGTIQIDLNTTISLKVLSASFLLKSV